MSKADKRNRLSGVRAVDLSVVCPSCGDETVWRVMFDRRELPTSFVVLGRESSATCDHWRDVHELVFQESFKHRRRLPVDGRPSAALE